MDIAAYCKSVGILQSDLAAQLGISPGRLSQLKDSNEWPADLALRLEEVTARVISASDVSPTIARARAA
jgi:DNA-binding transcriptional regulator YdaS (Cro superfamily)